jgi:DNA modification methylase
MSISWTLQKRSLSDLKENPKNPRQLNKEQAEHLKISLEKFGQCEPLVVTPDGFVIGGHQRLRTLKKLKHKKADVYVPDRELTEKEIEELSIRLNRNTGEWDFDILANEWEPLDLISWGFDPQELALEIEQIEHLEEDEDSAKLEPPKDPKTKLGDVYELNGHRLVCGDSTLPEYVEKCLNGAEPILMVTDPPYGVNYDASWRGAAGKGCTAYGKVQNDDQVNWALAWHLFPGSVAYVWYASLYHSEVEKSLIENEFKLVSQIICVKQNFALSRGDYHWQHETCLYAVKKGHKHNWQGSRKETTIWEISNLNAFGKSKEDGEDRTAHSTQKPIECMARPIRNNTAASEEVYDPFLGSGTTLIAAEQLGRTCYGLELDPAYCDIIVERWTKYMIKNNKEAIIKKNGEILNKTN